MASFNKVILIGNLTRDPELRSTPSGVSVCKLSIAVTTSYLGKDGQKKEDTAFVDIDSFGKQAENVSKFFTKGRPILVEGRLKYDQWDDKETGQKRSKLSVLMENFGFVDKKESSGASSTPSSSGYEDKSPPAKNRLKPQETNNNLQSDTIVDDDIPF